MSLDKDKTFARYVEEKILLVGKVGES